MGVVFRPGRGMNYFMVFHFTYMHCGDLNSAHKDFKSVLSFNLLKGLLN